MSSYHYRMAELEHADRLEQAKRWQMARNALRQGAGRQDWRSVSARAGRVLIRMGRMLGASPTEALDCGGSC